MSSRTTKAERIAADAWEQLTAAMTAAGGGARDAARDTAERAGDTAGRLADRASRSGGRFAGRAQRRVNAATDEAWSRAHAAADALAGRSPGLPWGLIAGVGLLGVAAGWFAATAVQAAAVRRARNEELVLVENESVPTPTFDA